MTEKHTPYFLIIGLGASGVSMARFLHARGETVVATDIDGSRASAARELNALGIHTEIGFHREETFNQAHTLVPSPGIPLTMSFIQDALKKGVKLTGELDIFQSYNTLPVVAITGTNGKTTTTTLIGDILAAAGFTPFVGGNIGTPLVENLMHPGNIDVIVAEISSFQLDLSHTFKPDVGILLNISEDHLDRYPDYAAYARSKWSLFKNQGPGDTAVINPGATGYAEESEKLNADICVFSSEIQAHPGCHAHIGPQQIAISTAKCQHTLNVDHLTELSGAHNRENISAAVLACLALGADIDSIEKGLLNFKNLSHRMEFVRTVNGVHFYDDSKATNTDAVIRAIECFKSNIFLILGGREKGTDFTQLIQDVKPRVKTILAIGESKTHIVQTFSGICPVIPAETMKDAVLHAFNTASEGDVVLLSPACASFDMYQNYAHRGNDFKTHVNNLEPA